MIRFRSQNTHLVSPPRRQVVLVLLGLAILVVGPVAVYADQSGGGPCGAQHPCFGMAFTGSPFSPASGHDQSFNAKDNVVPRTLVIHRGDSPTYEVNGMHWPAVY